MEDPVSIEDGHCYERAGIEAWFAIGGTTSPQTGALLVATPPTLIESHTLRNAIEEYTAAHMQPTTAVVVSGGGGGGVVGGAPLITKSPSAFTCPISFELMTDPVTTVDGTQCCAYVCVVVVVVGGTTHYFPASHNNLALHAKT